MRSGNIFWGLIIVIGGILLLLANLGLLPVDAWALIWPLALVLLGVWFLLGPRFARRNMEVTDLSLPLQGATRAEVRINHGAGRLEISSAAAPGTLLSGRFEGGVERTYHQTGDFAQVKLSLPSVVVTPFFGWHTRGFLWTIGLNPAVEYSLTFNTGAGEARLDLSSLKVTALRVDTGASDTEVSLPQAAGYTKVDLHGGANAIKLQVPPGVAARVHVEAVMAGVNVNIARFPKTASNDYQSPDYDTAANRVDIRFEGAIGSIDVK